MRLSRPPTGGGVSPFATPTLWQSGGAVRPAHHSVGADGERSDRSPGASQLPTLPPGTYCERWSDMTRTLKRITRALAALMVAGAGAILVAAASV
jgi:hypothetical protein